MLKAEKVLEIIKVAKALNPYPDDIFLEKTHKDWKKLQKALAKDGLVPDGYFGSCSRMVWNNCCDKLEEMVKREGVKKRN